MPNRPLTRANTPTALRVLLPLVTVFSWFICWQWFCVSPVELRASVVLQSLDELAPLEAWAALVGIGAAMMTTALAIHRKALYVYALAVVSVPFVMMTLVAGVAATHGVVSSSAWSWSAFVVLTCVACARALSVVGRDD